jgi:hypothetical protein
MVDRAVGDHAAIDFVAQQVEQRAAAERQPAHRAVGGGGPCLGDDAACDQPELERMDRPEIEVGREHLPDEVGLGGVYGQRARDQVGGPVVAKRRHPAHPHALGLRCRDLVADALAGDLTLEAAPYWSWC